MLIYLITNNFNNLVYVGQARKSLENRIYWYKKDLVLKKDKPNAIVKAMQEHGIENFTFTILEDGIDDQNLLDERERYWINYYQSNNPEKGYNKDTGGISGGLKSKDTKALISKTTRDKWANEDIANRMREGLRKGTETAKKNALSNFTTLICLNCGKEFKVKPFQAKTQKFCSNKCSGEYSRKSGRAKRASELAAIKAHQHNIDSKQEVKQYMIDWVSKHKDIVSSCPLNRIARTLRPMLKAIEREYNIKDIRTLFICFDVKNRKDFLSALQKYC